MSADSEFEQKWKERFQDFAAQGKDEAGVAGWSAPGLQTRLRFFQRHCDPAGVDRWLDIGCGAGTYCHWLNQRGCRVVGLDYSRPSLRRAKQFHPQGIDWVNGSALTLPFMDHSFSGVLCFGVSQVVHALTPLLAEMFRISRPGAQVWIDGLNLHCVPHRIEIARRKRQGISRHLNYARPQSLAAALAQSGFKVRAHYWLPMAPSRLSWLQQLLEQPDVDELFQSSRHLARLLSHSFVIQAERPQT